MGEIRIVSPSKTIGYPYPVCKNKDIFSISFKVKICCVCSLESPHRGDSYENT